MLFTANVKGVVDNIIHNYTFHPRF